VLRDHKVVVEREVHDRLTYAKQVGARLLLDVAEDANERNTAMVHYKDDRLIGKPWQRDSNRVLKGIFTQTNFNPFANVNYSLLN
jgi:archaeosine-15-forming tRNA-guanine transglycosylase